MKIRCEAFTDVGKCRNVNDDSIYMDGIAFSEQDFKSYREDVEDKTYHIFAVFDGICGCGYGALASGRACERLKEIQEILNARDQMLSYPENPATDSLSKLAYAIMDDLNETVIRAGKEVGTEIGTTVTMIISHKDGEACFINIGDSPGFFIKNREGFFGGKNLMPLGIMHTLAEMKRQEGRRPQRADEHVLIYYLGRENLLGSEMAAETIELFRFKDAGEILLVSDGVTGELKERAFKKRPKDMSYLDMVYDQLKRTPMADNASALYLIHY